MNAETLITRFDDKPFRFVFKTLVRTVSEKEGQDLCLKYRQENIDKTLPGHALEIDLRPAFERPLAEVQPKFASVPWEPSHLPQS